MSEMRRYVYFGRVPTNVCFNGVSLPLMPGDVIKCYPEFIAGFISPKWYKEAPPENTKAAKLTVPHTPFFLRPDPTGGLPMRSDPSPGPRLKGKLPYSPATQEEPLVNPYEKVAEGGSREALPEVETPKLELSTVPGRVISPPPEPEVVASEQVTEPEPAPFIEDETTEELIDIEEIPELAAVGITKSGLRKATRPEIYARVVDVRNSGCPLKPEMQDTFNAFTEETTRGGMFAALWEYYGFDKE